MDRKGFVFNRNKFKLVEVRYIPLPGDIKDYVTAWKRAEEIAKMLLAEAFLYHHIEKIEIYTLESVEPRSWVPGIMRNEAVCKFCQDLSMRPLV